MGLFTDRNVGNSYIFFDKLVIPIITVFAIGIGILFDSLTVGVIVWFSLIILNILRILA